MADNDQDRHLADIEVAVIGGGQAGLAGGLDFAVVHLAGGLRLATDRRACFDELARALARAMQRSPVSGGRGIEALRR